VDGEGEGGRDAEIAPSTPMGSPQQVGVVLLIDLDYPDSLA
jgi:hypothetical protein